MAGQPSCMIAGCPVPRACCGDGEGGWQGTVTRGRLKAADVPPMGFPAGPGLWAGLAHDGSDAVAPGPFPWLDSWVKLVFSGLTLRGESGVGERQSTRNKPGRQVERKPRRDQNTPHLLPTGEGGGGRETDRPHLEAATSTPHHLPSKHRKCSPECPHPASWHRGQVASCALHPTQHLLL